MPASAMAMWTFATSQSNEGEFSLAGHSRRESFPVRNIRQTVPVPILTDRAQFVKLLLNDQKQDRITEYSPTIARPHSELLLIYSDAAAQGK
jgi:hypothetical protein